MNTKIPSAIEKITINAATFHDVTMVFFSPRCDEESISVFARCPDRVVFHFSCQHTL